MRGLKTLELIAGSPDRQTLTSISKHLGIAMSSAHSICSTLLEEGYLERVSDGTFNLTLKVLDLATSKIGQYSMVDHFHALCDENPMIRENGATLTILDGPDVYFIAARNSPQPLGVTFQIGSRMPACCTASGRALLAGLKDEEVCRLYPDEEIPQLTKANPKYRTELLDILAEARRDGFSREIKGTRPHMFSYGARIVTPSGKAKAAVAIVMYEGDITPKVEAQAVSSIVQLAARLSEFGDLLQ
ncbi:MAG: IclR family transcriptional regulator [Pseudomonadota bacterium]